MAFLAAETVIFPQWQPTAHERPAERHRREAERREHGAWARVGPLPVSTNSPDILDRIWLLSSGTRSKMASCETGHMDSRDDNTGFPAACRNETAKKWHSLLRGAPHLLEDKYKH